MTHRRGIALIIVLAIVAILSVLVLEFSYSVWVDMYLSASYDARTQALYAAKAGVVQLTKSMAIELGGRGVLTNAIAPGSILTEGTKALFYDKGGQFSDKMQQMLAHIPVGKPGDSMDIAYAALFLAAPESSYINGHILTVDGGWTAGYIRDF